MHRGEAGGAGPGAHPQAVRPPATEDEPGGEDHHQGQEGLEQVHRTRAGLGLGAHAHPLFLQLRQQGGHVRAVGAKRPAGRVLTGDGAAAQVHADDLAGAQVSKEVAVTPGGRGRLPQVDIVAEHRHRGEGEQQQTELDRVSHDGHLDARRRPAGALPCPSALAGWWKMPVSRVRNTVG